MKRSKLLLTPIIAACALAPVALVTSCNQKTEAELIAEAIYNPVELDKEIITDDYLTHLKGFNENEKKACLIYDLFGFFNVPGKFGLPAGMSFTSLYTQQKVSIATNITQCNYTVTTDDKVKVNVLGYVSFIFNENLEKDQTIYYYANDYVMITYDILNREVEVDPDNCCLKYKPSKEGEQECVGMIKKRCGGKDAVSKLYYIESVNPAEDYPELPTNFKNLAKAQ